MLQELKNKILYSDLITYLIKTNKIICIYLGGSRLYNLDSPESDYDIIVITKDNSLINHQRKVLYINDLKIHLSIQHILDIINAIKNPKEIISYNINSFILDCLVLTEDNLIYSTKDYLYLHNVFIKYKEPLTILALENKLNSLYNKIYLPINTYKKVYYYYLLNYFLLNNFKEFNNIFLTDIQIDILFKTKTSKMVSPLIYSALKEFKIYKYYTNSYNYSSIYKEVKKYE